jgi:putative nucleotidyltransferase with HDIG domain
MIRTRDETLKKRKKTKNAKDRSMMDILQTLTYKHHEEALHSRRVSDYCVRMGEVLGLAAEKLDELRLAGMFHDIGKISIPDHIINKPGKLTDDEWTIMRMHPVIGYEILSAAAEYSKLAPYARSHHERIDGHGYPDQLKGDEIPLVSRIISISDAYEAMTADRPYRKAMDKKAAIEELRAHAGSQFDPRLVEIFISRVLEEDTISK